MIDLIKQIAELRKENLKTQIETIKNTTSAGVIDTIQQVVWNFMSANKKTIDMIQENVGKKKTPSSEPSSSAAAIY